MQNTTVAVSRRLDEVRYDIRGPLSRRAHELEAEGRSILRLHIGSAVQRHCQGEQGTQAERERSSSGHLVYLFSSCQRLLDCKCLVGYRATGTGKELTGEPEARRHASVVDSGHVEAERIGHADEQDAEERQPT